MNYFEILNLPIKYQLTANELESHFQHLAALYHPDKVLSSSVFKKREYMQIFTTLNEAYQTLKNPVTRAEYFLTLNNIEYNSEKIFQNDPELLETQILFREKIEECQTLPELSTIISEIELMLSSLLTEIANSIEKKNWDNLIKLIDKSKFFNKLLVATQQKRKNLEKE